MDSEKLQKVKEYLEQKLNDFKKEEDIDKPDELAIRTGEEEEEEEDEDEETKPSESKVKSVAKSIGSSLLNRIVSGASSKHDTEEMQQKLVRAYSIFQKQKKSKKDFVDNVITDFQKINDTTLGGYIVRDGKFEYPEGTKYKEWDNLKQAYGKLKVVPAFGSKQQDSHAEREDRFIGYWDTFTLVPKGEKGPTKPFVDENYNRVWAKQHTNRDISELSDLDENDLRDLPVSASYEDLGYGNKQIVGKVYHIATSLNKNERDRCSTEGGTPCRINVQEDHAQNSDVITTDFENLPKNNKGVSRADCSQPPTQKNKKKKGEEKTTKKEDVTKPKKEEEDEDDDEEEEKYAKKVDEKMGKESGKKYRKMSKTGTDMEDIIDMEEIKKLIATSVQDSIKTIKPAETVDTNDLKSLVSFLKEEKQQIANRKAQDLKDLLIKVPYNYKEDSLKDMGIEDLEKAKKFKEMQSDFQIKADKPITEVNKEIFLKAEDFQSMGYNPWRNVSKDFMNKRVALKEEVLLIR